MMNFFRRKHLYCAGLCFVVMVSGLLIGLRLEPLIHGWLAS